MEVKIAIPLSCILWSQVPDDLAPYYRVAEHLIGAGRDAARAERYLRAYLAQEPEGNEPTAADAARLLDRLRAKGASPEP